MAALGWLMNLDFAGGDGGGGTPVVFEDTPNMMRNYRGVKPGAPMSVIRRKAWTSLTLPVSLLR